MTTLLELVSRVVDCCVSWSQALRIGKIGIEYRAVLSCPADSDARSKSVMHENPCAIWLFDVAVRCCSLLPCAENPPMATG